LLLQIYKQASNSLLDQSTAVNFSIGDMRLIKTLVSGYHTDIEMLLIFAKFLSVLQEILFR